MQEQEHKVSKFIVYLHKCNSMISVIIPVYNTEKYISRCLESLISQTYSEWEAICVDDGSRDLSGQILDGYAGKDERIKVFHINNGGASHARNYALDRAKGDFLMLVDSDDFLHPQTMMLCMEAMERDHSDLVTFRYHHPYRTRAMIRHFLHMTDPAVKFRKYELSKVESKVSDDIFLWATEYSKPKDIDRKWAIKHCHPVKCLYRRERIEGLRFIEGIIYEDFPWWSAILLRTRRVTMLTLPLYFYYPNFSGYILSSTTKYRIESLKKTIDSAKAIFEKEGTEYQRKQWEKNFLIPFMNKLEKKSSKRRE